MIKTHKKIAVALVHGDDYKEPEAIVQTQFFEGRHRLTTEKNKAKLFDTGKEAVIWAEEFAHGHWTLVEMFITDCPYVVKYNVL